MIVTVVLVIGLTVVSIGTSTEHDALPMPSSVLLWFVVPMTVCALLMLSVHEIRSRRRSATPTGR